MLQVLLGSFGRTGFEWGPGCTNSHNFSDAAQIYLSFCLSCPYDPKCLRGTQPRSQGLFGFSTKPEKAPRTRLRGTDSDRVSRSFWWMAYCSQHAAPRDAPFRCPGRPSACCDCGWSGRSTCASQLGDTSNLRQKENATQGRSFSKTEQRSNQHRHLFLGWVGQLNASFRYGRSDTIFRLCLSDFLLTKKERCTLYALPETILQITIMRAEVGRKLPLNFIETSIAQPPQCVLALPGPMFRKL